MKKMQIIFRSLLTVAMLLSGSSMMAALAAKQRYVPMASAKTALCAKVEAHVAAQKDVEAKQKSLDEKRKSDASASFSAETKELQDAQAAEVQARGEVTAAAADVKRAEKYDIGMKLAAKMKLKATEPAAQKSEKEKAAKTTNDTLGDKVIIDAQATVAKSDEDYSTLGFWAKIKTGRKGFLIFKNSRRIAAIASKISDTDATTIAQALNIEFKVTGNTDVDTAAKQAVLASVKQQIAVCVLEAVDAEQEKVSWKQSFKNMSKGKKAAAYIAGGLAAAAAVYLKFFRNK